jgi:Rrf2 family nitric oxide-sensitive transcriptional repressor
VRLARPPEAINVGEVVRRMERGLVLVDCSTCVLAPTCRLTGVLGEALEAFFVVLGRHTLAEIATPAAAPLLGPAAGPAP